MAKLTEDFFARDTLTVARELLGCYLVRPLDGVTTACRITETEAYIGRIDKACHAYGYRRTPRTAPLYASPGTVYIYLIYGMYYCLNFVTEPQEEPCAVLIRGLSPVLGQEALSLARYGVLPQEQSRYQQKNFLNGPGKVCKALSLTKAENCITLFGDALWVCDSLSDLGLPEAPPTPPPTVHIGPRINIDYAEEAIDFPWRFWIEIGRAHV